MEVKLVNGGALTRRFDAANYSRKLEGVKKKKKGRNLRCTSSQAWEKGKVEKGVW